MRHFWPVLFLGLTGCGYHISGHANLMPKEIKTIAIPAFGDGTTRPRLANLITTDVTREFNSRTKYNIIATEDQADAVLRGTLMHFVSFPIVSDPVSGRATGIQVVATLQIILTDRHTGKTLFQRQGLEFRERYEVTLDPNQYFDESGTGVQRLSRDVARSVVSAILENF